MSLLHYYYYYYFYSVQCFLYSHCAVSCLRCCPQAGRWQSSAGWDSTLWCVISALVQFGTDCLSRNLAPSLHLSHSNYNLLKSCYPTPHSDNDSDCS